MPDVQAMIPGFPQNMSVRYGTILSGASATDLISTDGMAPVGIIIPSAWTAADLGYKLNWDGQINDSLTAFDGFGTAMTTVAAANSWIVFPLSNAVYAPYMQITSVAAGGGSVTPVTQGADRKILIIFRRFLS